MNNDLQKAEKKLQLQKQECALAEKEFKILKLQSDIERLKEELSMKSYVKILLKPLRKLVNSVRLMWGR